LEFIKTKHKTDGNPQRMTAFLEALRVALIRLFIAVCIVSLAAYSAAETFLEYFVKLTAVRLAAYGVPETFLALVALALGTGLFINTPYLFYAVLAPLPAHFSSFSRRQMFGFWIASILLFYAGSVFCLKITLPYGVRFLLSFEAQHIHALISVRRFVSFCLLFLFGFGFIFELPLAMMVLGRIGLINGCTLSDYRRYAILGITLVSAVLTPTPDVFNLALMAVPLYLLYEIGILGMHLWPPNTQRHQTIRKAKALV
jgi:sec-independent protein translocase protein TatC